MAKSSIGSLLINLELQTATLNKQVGKVNKKFDGMTSTFKKVGVALAGAFAIRGIASMVTSTLALNDALGKTADRLGISAEGLQALHYGAEQSGVSTATLDMALQRMTRRVSEAGLGTGEAVKALKELNIEASELAKMPLEQQLDVLADALKGVESEADQVRLAMKLFDSEGVKLLTMLKGGSEGLNEFKENAQDLGFIMSRDMIASMERANDSIHSLGKVGDGFKNMLTVALAPALSVVSREFISFFNNSTDATKSLDIMRQTVIGAVKVYDVLSSTLSVVIAGWEKLYLRMRVFFADDEIKAIEEYNNAFAKTEVKITELAKAIDGTSRLQKLMNEEYAKTVTISNAVDLSYKKVDTTLKAVTKTAKEQKEEWQKIGFVFTNAFSNMENQMIDFMKTGKASFSDFTTAILEDLARMIIRLQITIPLMNALKGAMGFGSLTANANGNVISGGKVQAFASGGIVSSPTVFPMANGIGLMGEAGSEAILPLSRGSGGDLGVKASGIGGSTVVNIYNESGSNAEVSESEDGNGQRIIEVMIKSSVKKSFGDGSMDKTLSANYGIKRKGL